MPTVTRLRIKKQKRLIKSECHFSRAIKHMNMISDRIQQLMIRHDDAQKTGMKALQYNLRIRMAVMEGVRSMYYEYAKRQADELVILRKELFGEDLEVVMEE